MCLNQIAQAEGNKTSLQVISHQHRKWVDEAEIRSYTLGFRGSRVLEPVDSWPAFLGKGLCIPEDDCPSPEASFLLSCICGPKEESASGGLITQQLVAYLHYVPHWPGWVPWESKEVCGNPYPKWTSLSSGRENVNTRNVSTTIQESYVVKCLSKLPWQLRNTVNSQKGGSTVGWVVVMLPWENEASVQPRGLNRISLGESTLWAFLDNDMT